MMNSVSADLRHVYNIPNELAKALSFL